MSPFCPTICGFGARLVDLVRNCVIVPGMLMKLSIGFNL